MKNNGNLPLESKLLVQISPIQRKIRIKNVFMVENLFRFNKQLVFMTPKKSP